MGIFHRKDGLTTACCGLITLGGLVLGGLMTPSAFAQAAPDPADQAASADKTVSIDVAAGDLHAVVLTLERQTKVEALVRDGDRAYKPVYVHLEDASLPKALRTIAQSAGAKVSRNADDVYVFEPEDTQAGSTNAGAPAAPPPGALQAAQTAVAPTPQPMDHDNDPEGQFPAGSLQWRRIVLQHAVPNDILKLMRWDRDVVDMDPLPALRMPEAHPVITSTQGTTLLGPASPYGYPSVPLGNGNAGTGAANYSAHRTVDPASPDQAHQFPGFPDVTGGAGGVPGGFGTPGGATPGGGTFNPFQINQIGGGGPGGQNNNGLTRLGVARIFALQSDNSLLVEATPDGFKQVTNIVKMLDIAPRQVQIKVEFVTASVSDVDNLGINFDLVPYPGLEFGTQNGTSTITSAAAPTFLQYATGNLVAQLYQTLVRSRGKVVQAPLITTTNNVTATIAVNTTIPFFTTSVVSTGGLNGGTAQGQQANFLQLTTGLTITPRINSDDSVTMNLNPQITDTTGQPAVGGIPPTITQSITTLRTVRSGDTMVLGGLVRKQETTSSIRIPILSDIPILGGLFRTRDKQVNDQELLIFVTPTIIGESNDSAAANANGGQTTTVTP